ncbi:hypothetical protein Bxe_B0819 [Paraburkholderia xenovorans LB400]|uniref:Uncharacterized protein n=1 Tax=Paraburkholderia xenovorans (strain LB400) TaxID=266265 RepID=Q13LA4_PARXL|nr:hypothetical protein Bxe_B0819 [Paraburkholderia xenovorans LB400]
MLMKLKPRCAAIRRRSHQPSACVLTIANNSTISIATLPIWQTSIYYVMLTISLNDDLSINRYQHLHMEFRCSQSGVTRTRIRPYAPIA